MPKALINGEILRWARERAAIQPEELASRIGQDNSRVSEWESGKAQPTFKQAQRLARLLHVPFGYLFLPQPPSDEIPLPDLRTLGSEPARALDLNSRALLEDVLFKHAWFVNYLVDQGQEPLPFVGKFDARANATEVAADIRNTLKLEEAIRASRNWEAYLRLLIDKAEDASIWVMRSGIVGSNTHRPLSVQQFRGFAIADSIAPLVFINGRDVLAGQIFTFAHELSHIWLGSTGVSNVHLDRKDFGTNRATEVACNKIAGEVLVPEIEFRELWSDRRSEKENYELLSQHFKVSQIVVARRALDLGQVTDDLYSQFYRAEQARWVEERRQDEEDESSGGNFYNTLPLRNGSRFTRAVVSQAMAGGTLLRDAGMLLNMQPSSVVKYFKKAVSL
jgi:Zn-dependent peptidase ImmA (M78 family)/DNA-binding XRE family transcriptional regulator